MPRARREALAIKRQFLVRVRPEIEEMIEVHANDRGISLSEAVETLLTEVDDIKRDFGALLPAMRVLGRLAAQVISDVERLGDVFVLAALESYLLGALPHAIRLCHRPSALATDVNALWAICARFIRRLRLDGEPWSWMIAMNADRAPLRPAERQEISAALAHKLKDDPTRELADFARAVDRALAAHDVLSAKREEALEWGRLTWENYRNMSADQVLNG